MENTIIRSLRIFGDTVWVATNRGAYSHSAIDLSGPWKQEFVPNPDYLPGGAQSTDPNAPYKNIINDFAVGPERSVPGGPRRRLAQRRHVQRFLHQAPPAPGSAPR